MKTHRPRLVAFGIAIWIVLTFPTLAEARGWCNTGQLGPEDFQSQVISAGSSFYNAMSLVWQSFAQTENAQFGEAISTANSSLKNFSAAGEQYQRAAKSLGGDVNQSLQSADFGSVKALAGAPSADLEALIKTAASGNGYDLLNKCSTLAVDVMTTVSAYVEALRKDPNSHDVDAAMWRSLDAINAASYAGRNISIIFEAAARKKE